MATGDNNFPQMHPVAGFRLGTASAGIKKPGRKDLVVMELAEGSSLAGVFTRNAFCAAPVQVAKRHLETGGVRLLVTNTGNANAGTGEQGLRDAERVCSRLAGLAEVRPEQVMPFSTGVIGEPLPVGKIEAALPDARDTLSESGWHDAAEGILTTDTRPKGASVQVAVDGGLVTVTGIAKGSGMIRPDMATMLGYIATDACIPASDLQEILSGAVNRSFNRITIDGDTSTNDAVVLAATGRSGIELTGGNRAALEGAICQVAESLARAIVRDGEGATKFVTVRVEGGGTEQECLDVAYTVAESPLVKTALFASDPNWGRILAAIGRAGVNGLDVDRVRVWLDEVLIAEKGGRAADYREEDGQAVMDREDILISIDLDRGSCVATVWTTDLSHDYVKINAEYRT